MSEQEFKEWLSDYLVPYIDRWEEDGSAIFGVDKEDLLQLFKGKKLVDAGSVVVDREALEIVVDSMGKQENYQHPRYYEMGNKLKQALAQEGL